MHPLENEVLKTITRQRLLRSGRRLVVAISGGSDSVALLTALLALKERLDLELRAAHVNHLLRGGESDQDEEFVRALCEKHGVHLTVRRIETQRLAEASRLNLENCARRERYAFLLEVAGVWKAAVATAHTLNDLAETFLLKLFRGAGMTGLAGIFPLRENHLPDGFTVDVIRPLLDVTRAEILDYLGSRRQAFREDSSNRDVSFDRNEVRHQLIPLLEARFNPEVVRVIGRTANLLREMQSLTSPVAQEAYERCRLPGVEDVVLAIPRLLDEAPAMQREVTRRAIQEFKGDLADVSFRHVEDALKIAAGESGGECHLPGSLVVRREFDQLVFGSGEKTGEFCYELDVPGDVYIREVSKRVAARRVRAGDQTAGVLLNLRTDRLRLRNRRPGDTYRTRFDRGPRKLKELLIEHRVPKGRRDRLVLIEAASEVVWVEGLPPDPRYSCVGRAADAVEIAIRNETFEAGSLLDQ